jgi:hypothetical protein
MEQSQGAGSMREKKHSLPGAIGSNLAHASASAVSARASMSSQR